MRLLLVLVLAVPCALAHPAYNIAADGKGNVYFLDWPRKRLMRVSRQGVVAVVADLSSKVAPQTYPHTLALQDDGNLLVGATYEGRAWRVSQRGQIKELDLKGWDLSGGSVLNLALTGSKLHMLVAHERKQRFRLLTQKTKQLLDVRRGQPGYRNLYNGSFCVVRDGTVYLSADNRIWKLKPGARPVVFAGAKTPGMRDGNGTAARFAAPYGMCLDAKGGPGGTDRLLVADKDNGRIRAIDAEGNVTTLPAKLVRPHAVCTAPDGLVCVAEYGSGVIRIRVIEKQGVRTLASVKTR